MSGRAAAPSDVPWRFTRDAAAYVGLGENAFRAAVKRGEIAQIKDSGHPRYLICDLDAYLTRKRQPARAEIGDQKAAGKRRGPVIQLPSGINRITRRPYETAAR
jgi:hypothetical protein